MSNILYFLGLLFFSMFMASTSWANGGSGDRVIAKVYSENGSIYIAPSQSFDNPDSCTNADLAVIQSSNLGQDHMVAMAITALTTGKQVWFWFAGCQSGTFPIVWRMDLKAS